jgi:AraC family transcriptional regulator
MVKLEPGKYYGNLIKKAFLKGLYLSETSYYKDTVLPVHEHKNIFFCFVLIGKYSENYENKKRFCETGTLIFHPRYERHSDLFGQNDAKCFNIEIEDSWFKDLSYRKDYLERSFHLETGEYPGMFYKIYKNFVEFDEVSELAIHGILLNLIAELIRIENQTKKTIPSWLIRIKEKLHDCQSEKLNLIQLSRIADVHPVHLARTFKIYFKCTPGDYLRKIRIDKSISLLRKEKISLSEISLECGFSDQSHFSKIFKKHTGFSPKKYRTLIKAC